MRRIKIIFLNKIIDRLSIDYPVAEPNSYRTYSTHIHTHTKKGNELYDVCDLTQSEPNKKNRSQSRVQMWRIIRSLQIEGIADKKVGVDEILDCLKKMSGMKMTIPGQYACRLMNATYMKKSEQ